MWTVLRTVNSRTTKGRPRPVQGWQRLACGRDSSCRRRGTRPGDGSSQILSPPMLTAGVPVHGLRVTEGLRDRRCGRALHPLWNRSLATPNHSSDDEVIREEAASIAASQVPADASVDVSEADWRQCGSCRGGADRSALRKRDAWRCARNSSASVLVLIGAPDLDSGARHRSASGIDGVHRARATVRVGPARRPSAFALPGWRGACLAVRAPPAACFAKAINRRSGSCRGRGPW
jgi:hypothetical protein